MDTLTIRLTLPQARALIGAYGGDPGHAGDLGAAVRALQAAVDAAHVAALEGRSITDPDGAFEAVRACADWSAATDLVRRGIGWQAVIALARRAGIPADNETVMTREWCERVALAVRL